ncbi:MAG: tRNA threonylcarbamoyladenosine biosynthesis protein TsaB [Lentisphaerae bacterium ADurb.BinA184]|nr:MAG: tRNA threonylcarbamoyladenosine biosynthesis protein TsaB [Lentisphaerae bacterium ADurb.BinA184]
MIEAALDTSLGLSLAVGDGGKILCRQSLARPRHDSDESLAPWVQESLASCDLRVENVVRWTVGLGPGSFAGLRCGIAFVRGICLLSGAWCRGLPSSLALALQAEVAAAGGSPIAVLHDGRRGQVILSLYALNGAGMLPTEPPVAVPAAELPARLEACAVAVTAQPDAVLPLLDAGLRARVQSVSHIDAGRLLAPAGWPWPEGAEVLERSCEPIYVRPAVFVEPVTRRTGGPTP